MPKIEKINIDGEKLRELLKERTGKTMTQISKELDIGYSYFTLCLGTYDLITVKTAQKIWDAYAIKPEEYTRDGAPVGLIGCENHDDLVDRIFEPVQTEEPTKAEEKTEEPEEPVQNETPEEPEQNEEPTKAEVQIEEPTKAEEQTEEPIQNELTDYAHELARAVLLFLPEENEGELVHDMLDRAKDTMRRYALDVLKEV